MAINQARLRQGYISVYREAFGLIEDTYRAIGIQYHRVSYAVRSMPPNVSSIPPEVLNRLSQAFLVEQATREGAGSPQMPDLHVHYDGRWAELERLQDDFEAGIHTWHPQLIDDAMQRADDEMQQLFADLVVLQDAEDRPTSAGRADSPEQQAQALRNARWWMVVRLPEVRRAILTGVSWETATATTFVAQRVDDESLRPNLANAAAEAATQAADPNPTNATADAAPSRNDELRPDNPSHNRSAQAFAEFERRRAARDELERQKRIADPTYVTIEDMLRMQADHPDLTHEQQHRVARTINRRLEEFRRQNAGNQ